MAHRMLVSNFMKTVLPAANNRTAYAVVLNPFSDRPLFWTGGMITDDIVDVGGFDLADCERTAAFYRSRTYGTYGAGYAHPQFDAVIIVEVTADRWGNVPAAKELAAALGAEAA